MKFKNLMRLFLFTALAFVFMASPIKGMHIPLDENMPWDGFLKYTQEIAPHIKLLKEQGVLNDSLIIGHAIASKPEFYLKSILDIRKGFVKKQIGAQDAYIDLMVFISLKEVPETCRMFFPGLYSCKNLKFIGRGYEASRIESKEFVKKKNKLEAALKAVFTAIKKYVENQG